MSTPRRSPSPPALFLPAPTSETSDAEVGHEESRTLFDEFEFDVSFGRQSPNPTQVEEVPPQHAYQRVDEVVPDLPNATENTVPVEGSGSLPEETRDIVMEEFEEWLASGAVEIV